MVKNFIILIPNFNRFFIDSPVCDRRAIAYSALSILYAAARLESLSVDDWL